MRSAVNERYLFAFRFQGHLTLVPFERTTPPVDGITATFLASTRESIALDDQVTTTGVHVIAVRILCGGGSRGVGGVVLISMH